MEGEHQYELRSRSRSRSHTPMIFNQTITDFELNEHHYDLRSKESRERSHTPAEISSSRRSNSKSLTSSAQKPKDVIMEPIVEKTEGPNPEIMRQSEDHHDEYSSSVTQQIKKGERRSERQRVKRQILINGQDESKQDNTSIEVMTEQQHQQAQLRKSLTPSRTVTSDYSSEEGERDELPSRPGSAYEIYKQAGDWWNVFPKTDYTYSRASQCRYEIAPGVLAMPNMSRPSIHSDSSSVGSSNSLSQHTNETIQSSHNIRQSHTDLLNGEDTIAQNRLNEENARLFGHSMEDNSNSHLIYNQTHVQKRSHRREIIYDNFNTTHKRYGSFSSIDSDTELDEAVTLKINHKRWRIIKWFEKLKNVIILMFVNTFEFIYSKLIRKKSINSSQQYHRYRESNWTRIWNKIDHAFQYMYLFLIRILFLDSWLLSRVTNFRERFLASRSRILWLILLPPLLFAGFWLLPYGYNLLTFLRFAGTLSQQMRNGEDISSTLHQSIINIQEGLNVKPNEEMSEESRQLIERLVNRIDELETAQNNNVELLVNITKSIIELKNNGKDSWKDYENKLYDLESKVIANDNDKKAHNDIINNIKMECNNFQQYYATLKTCCNKNNIILNSNIERHVRNVIGEYFGNGISKAEMNKIVENLNVANKNSLDINCKEKNNNELAMTEDQVQRIVKEILRIYDADKTGRVDYALESAGGQIISIRCTQRYNVNTRAFKVFGLTLYYESGDPRTVIQGHSLQPGVCWAFQDFPGYLLIKLRSPIKVTGFTMEHAPRSILPNNKMKSAPRKFNVWGFKEENDIEPILFGEYEFTENDDSLQYFPVQNQHITHLYEYIELRIHSNHGQLEYTCLYRFRVHGIPG